ncbi:hypothetical protein V1515DRAFT_361155 [Lipomyces mesembrius]
MLKIFFFFFFFGILALSLILGVISVDDVPDELPRVDVRRGQTKGSHMCFTHRRAIDFRVSLYIRCRRISNVASCTIIYYAGALHTRSGDCTQFDCNFSPYTSSEECLRYPCPS